MKILRILKYPKILLLPRNTEYIITLVYCVTGRIYTKIYDTCGTAHEINGGKWYLLSLLLRKKIYDFISTDFMDIFKSLSLTSFQLVARVTSYRKSCNMNKSWISMLWTITFFIFLVVMNQPKCTLSNVFTSIRKLKQMVMLETQMIAHFDEYLDVLRYEVQSNLSRFNEEKYHTLHNFRLRSKSENKLARENDSWMENPINIFHTLQRMVREWTGLTHIVQCPKCFYFDSSKDFTGAADLIMNKTSWPNETDLIGAAVAIERLIVMYNLDLYSLADGYIFESKTDPMTAEDFAMMGECLFEAENYKQAIVMYNMSKVLFYSPDYHEADNVLYSLTNDDIYRLTEQSLSLQYMAAVREFGDLDLWKSSVQDAVRLNPHNPFLINTELDIRTSNYSRLCVNSIDEQSVHYPNHLYKTLCNQEMKTDNETQDLYCSYWPMKNTLAKAKAEYLNLDPAVVLFHDVVSETEIEFMKDNSYIHLHRSRVASGINSSTSNSRISQTAWLKRYDIILHKITRRISHITNLIMHNSSEPLQVLNYGLGGMYEPHYDFFSYRPVNVTGGNRIATFILYLSDIQYGGATVFPELKTRVPVHKGNALFWFNLLRNGSCDRRMLHAGCPVLLGSKWIVNKWVREASQLFTRPCSLNQAL